VAKTFLRSGNLDAVLALGENGQPVYASALQIRETLRLRRQTALANCLAIPQPNARGDRLDWYAPFSGKVKSWLGASDRERRQALEQLTATQQEMQALSARAREADNPAMRLFGALLSKALQFPDQQYVYLVDGKPVITFWGFVDAQARTRDDALACLRDTLEASLPPLLPELTVVEPQPAIAEMPQTIAEPEPLPEPVVDVSQVVEPPAVASAAPPAIAPTTPRRPFRLLYLAPVALAVAGAAAFWLHQPTPVAAPAAAPTATAIAPPAALIARLKILGGLDIAERRLPQDGQFTLTLEGKPAAFRLATLPVQYGEKAVIRLLQSESSTLSLDKLGLPAAQRRAGAAAGTRPGDRPDRQRENLYALQLPEHAEPAGNER